MTISAGMGTAMAPSSIALDSAVRTASARSAGVTRSGYRRGCPADAAGVPASPRAGAANLITSIVPSPRSSGDRAPPSGGGCAGSNPAGGTHRSRRPGFERHTLDGDTGQRYGDARGAGDEQCADDAAAGDEQPQEGGGKHRDLPGALQRKAQWDSGSGDSAHNTCAGSGEERLYQTVCAQSVKIRATEDDETKGWAEGDQCGEQATADAGRGVADDSDGLHDRARSDLTQRHRVQELRTVHPVVCI